ncbi:lipase family protein [Nocardia thailandica]|uniref:Alpha/beta hydrolase n=1 Tax=Nocardia thailandica TaxID=257275 RepID=A0ABW6PXD3_9NOCA
MTVKPNEEWDLHGSTAWVFTTQRGLQRPFVLVADGGPADMAALGEAADAADFALRAQLTQRGYDLILVGFDHDPADPAKSADTVRHAVLRAVAQRLGSVPLMLGGIGRGALVARYALARMEHEHMDHQTQTYYSYNGVAPTAQEAGEFERVGGMPRRPRLLKITAGAPDLEGLGRDADPDASMFDDWLFTEGAADGLMSPEAGTWLLDRLPY